MQNPKPFVKPHPPSIEVALCCGRRSLVGNRFGIPGAAALAPALVTLDRLAVLKLARTGMPREQLAELVVNVPQHPVTQLLLHLKKTGCKVILWDNWE